MLTHRFNGGTQLSGLSGRHTIRTRPVTASGLLVGLERWFAVRDLLEDYTPTELDPLVRQALPFQTQTRSNSEQDA